MNMTCYESDYVRADKERRRRNNRWLDLGFAVLFLCGLAILLSGCSYSVPQKEIERGIEGCKPHGGLVWIKAKWDIYDEFHCADGSMFTIWQSGELKP